MVRVMMAVLGAVLAMALSLGSSGALADPAVKLQVVIQPKASGGDSRPIALDAGDPLTLGSQIALMVTATADTTVNIRYLPSDGQPTMLAQGLALKSGETKRLPDNPASWYAVSSGNGEERMVAEDASGTQIATVAYRIVQSAPTQLAAAGAGDGGQAATSAGGIDLSRFTQTPAVVAKSEAISKTLEQAPSVGNTRSIGSDVFKKMASGVVLVVNGDSLGSGVILDENGLVVTNHHVVVGADEVSVIFMPAAGADIEGAKSYDATVERLDVVADLALIRIKNPPEHMTVVPLGDPSATEVGEEVNAIGHPQGEFWSYTRGYVSQLRPKYPWYDGAYDHLADVIQTQTPINPGNSGGPLMDDEGRLLGINSFGRPDSQGLNYAVSVDEVTRVMQMKGDRLADGTLVEASAEPSVQSESTTVQPTATKPENASFQTWEYDDNHDGKTDRWGVDMSKDGKPDLFLVDQDGDGKADFALVDRNEDGKPEARIIYGDKSKGECDVWEIDDNEDGKIDAIGMDYDYDGKPDVVRPE